MDIFGVVSDPTRREMLERLRTRALTPSELAATFRVSQPAISRHLRVLHEAGLVHVTGARDDGRARVYSLRPEPLGEIEVWLSSFWQRKLDAFAAYVKEHT